MHSVKVDYSNREAIIVEPLVGADWYATGYCISHFNERWGLVLKDATYVNIDVLVMGLRSTSVAKGNIQVMEMISSSFSLSQIFSQLRRFCQLRSVKLQDCSCSDNDVALLQQLIVPGSGLRRLVYKNMDVNTMCADTLVPTLLAQSSLEELTIDTFFVSIKTDLLPLNNTNLKVLVISDSLLRSLAVLLPNITSLAYLRITSIPNSDLPVLTEVVRSHATLQVLEIGGSYQYNEPAYTPSLLQLVKTAGSNQLQELRLVQNKYDSLPLHIREQYKHLLKCIQRN